MQIAERRVPIQYSNRTASAYGGEKSFVPIKLNSVNVIPVIFASAIIGIPSLVATVINKESFTNFVNNYIDFNYCKVDTIEFIENLNYEECMELLKKLDFSNYATIYQVKE